MSNQLDYFKLMRVFWDWSFENPEIVKPNHCALYAFAVEHCNRLGWKPKFGLPTTMAMEALGIKSYNTYIKTLNELVDHGFITMVQKSKNQYSANIIALSNNNKALNKALDKAFIKHGTKQVESIDSIDKQDTSKPKNKEEKPQLSVEETFNLFWDRYHEVTGVKKTDKEPALKYWKKLTLEERKKAYVKAKPYSTTNQTKYLKKARTYLSDKNFNDDFENVAEPKEDARLYVKNHLTYGQLIGKEPIRSDKYPEYNGLFYHQLKDEFLKPKS